MEFKRPKTHIVTVYSKSDCKYCDKLKHVLTNSGIEHYIINCDEYLLVHRETFLEFIKEISHGQTVKTFPMVFNPDTKYIGGYAETMEYIERVIMEYEGEDF